MEIDSGPNMHRNYKVMQKLITMRPVYEIYDDTGAKIAVAKQTWLSIIRSTMNIEDAYGNLILTAKGGFFDFTFWLIDSSGQRIAKLTRPWIALFKNFTIYYRDETIKAQGGVLAWGFEAVSDTGLFAFRLDKKILAIRDTFQVSVGDYMNPLHAITSALVVDRIFFKGKGCGCRLIACLICILIPIIITIVVILSLLAG
jgi:uncharacterized protein YxjI